ncbi:MAG: winged helix-turn-helix domain-containing protein, partial [Alloprevotella sp.]|nr:winged helix-turn-helix domain-containing protein [Alloprevotella sp.]
KQPGRVFSREEILAEVWPDDCYVLDRTVDVHIARVRRKLGEEGNRISNRQGYGYCFEA